VPRGWKIPHNEQLRELYKCKCHWDDQMKGNGVTGM
jgi:hypothetical protein